MRISKLPVATSSCNASKSFVNQDCHQKPVDSVMDINSIPTLPKSHVVVQHNYHDHANENLFHLVSNDRPFHRNTKLPFPLKLHEMLNKVEEDGHADVISWQPHGRCLLIHKPKAFREILPKYFQLSKVTSFQRQLNLYGFSRITRGRDKGGYYHELFLRGKQTLAYKIQRIKIKGTGVRARSNPNAEPNLWDMQWVGCVTSLQCGTKKKIKVEPSLSCQGIEQDNALICSFEGKQFHYLDEFEMAKDEKRQSYVNGDRMSHSKIETIISEPQLDDILRDTSFVEAV